MKGKYLLEVRNLKKSYEISNSILKKNKNYLNAVNDLNFYVREGETLGIVGESGSGKSTTANLIVQLLDPTSGEIIFNGEDLTKLNAKDLRKKRSEIQIIFQDPFSALNPRMKVFDIIAEPLKTHENLSKKELHNRIMELMDTVKLNRSYASRFPHEFSGGQRQRISIARAIALRPKLIVCDEPVSALDVSIQSQILNLLIDLQKKYNLTYVFIAHGLPAVKYVSDRIGVMYLGRIVELANKNELFFKTKHPYTNLLLSSIPIHDPYLRAIRKEIQENEISNSAEDITGCHFHPRCSFAQDICRKQAPEFKEVDNQHYVACHFPLST